MLNISNSRVGLIIIILIAVLFIMILIIFNNFYSDLKKNNFECSQNPLNFGAKGIEEANYHKVLCSCSLINYSAPTLFFNSSSKWFSENNLSSTQSEGKIIDRNFNASSFLNKI